MKPSKYSEAINAAWEQAELLLEGMEEAGFNPLLGATHLACQINCLREYAKGRSPNAVQRLSEYTNLPMLAHRAEKARNEGASIHAEVPTDADEALMAFWLALDSIKCTLADFGDELDGMSNTDASIPNGQTEADEPTEPTPKCDHHGKARKRTAGRKVEVPSKDRLDSVQQYIAAEYKQNLPTDVHREKNNFRSGLFYHLVATDHAAGLEPVKIASRLKERGLKGELRGRSLQEIVKRCIDFLPVLSSSYSRPPPS